MKKILLLVVCLGLIVLGAAQTKIVDDGDKPRDLLKAACFPPIYTEGGKACTNKTAIDTINQTARELIQGIGMEWVDEGRVNNALQSSELDSERKELPTGAELLRLGKALNVDYIISYRCDWRIRSPWVGLGPKTKAHAKVDFVIVDVKQGTELKIEGKETDSTKKEAGWETAGALLLTPIFTAVSGGPKTPHMQRSGQMAFLQSIEKWSSQFGTPSRKIKTESKR